MGTDHIHALLIGLSLSLSAISFFVWAWLDGIFHKPEEPAIRVFEIESKQMRFAHEIIAKRFEAKQNA